MQASNGYTTAAMIKAGNDGGTIQLGSTYGIIAIMHYLAKYCKRRNIRVNCISPGGILDNQPESFLKKYRSSCTSKGMLDPEDLVGALLYLLSDQSRYVNGHNIIVDDGWSL